MAKVVANSFIDYNESCKLLVVLIGNSVIHTTVNNDQDVKTSIISVVKVLKAYDFSSYALLMLDSNALLCLNEQNLLQETVEDNSRQVQGLVVSHLVVIVLWSEYWQINAV